MTWKEKTKKVSGNQIIDSSITFDNLGCTIDEDNMASDSATHVPTQQSVKAYVDANGGGGSSQWTTTGSDIYYNTGNVGIGTTTPIGSLVVSSSGEEGIEFFPNNFTNGNTIQHYDRLNSVYSIVKNIAADHRFNIGTTEAMRIDSSGKVGIGTTSPSSYNSAGDNLVIAETTGSAGITLVSGTTGAGHVLFADSTTGTGAYDGFIKYSHQDLEMTFAVNAGVARMVIDSSGFVGIGTTTPSSPLHIHTDDPDFIQEMDSTATANLIQHNFNVDGVTEGALLYDKANELFELRTTKELKFGAGNNAERMRIDSTGNVGIGTSSPANTLSIKGSVNQLDIETSTTGVTLESIDRADHTAQSDLSYYARHGEHKFYNSAYTQAMTIDSSGNVGIGTTSPDKKLHVKDGDIRIESTFPRIYFQDTNQNSDYSIMNSDGSFSIYDDTNAVYRMRIDASGQVGIGTTSPSSPLHVNNTVTASDSLSEGITLSNPASFTNNRLPAITWDYGAAGTPTFAAIDTSRATGTGGNLLFHTASTAGSLTERMRINSSGQVGIGTDSPDALLHVDGGDLKISSDLNTSDGDGIPSILFAEVPASSTGVNDVNGGIVYNGDGPTAGNNYIGIGCFDSGLATEDTLAEQKLATDLNILRNGNVGIGTTSPSAKLHIDSGATDEVLRLEGTGSPYLSFYDTGVRQSYIGSFGNTLQIHADTPDTNIAFYTEGTHRATIDSSGNLGIGTTSPFNKLDIDSGTDAVSARCQTSTTGALIAFKDATATEVSIPAAVGGVGNELSFITNNTEKVRIDDSGYVGIGTNSPKQLLHVQNTGIGDEYTPSTYSNAIIEDTDAYLEIVSNSEATWGSTILLKEHNVVAGDNNDTIDVWGISRQTKRIGDGSGVNGKGDGSLRFTYGTGNDNNTSSTKVTFASSGNVGIGTTDPQASLHISAGTSGDATIIIEADTDDNNEDDNPSIGFKQDGGLLESQIGHTSYGSANQNALKIANSVSSGGIEFLTGTTTGASNATSRMFIDPDGKIAINGAVDATVDLRVHGETTTDRLGVGSNNLGGYNIESRTSDAIHALFKSSGTTASYIYFRDGNSTIDSAAGFGAKGDECSIVAGGAERVRIDSSGNVGIGTTDPSVELDVSGTIRATTSLNIGNSSEVTALSLYSGSAAAAGTFESNATGAYIIFKDATATTTTPVGIGAVGNECFIIAGDTEKVRIDDNGNVGIGTNDPAEKLDVQGNITATGVATLGGGSVSAPTYSFESDTNTGIYNPSNFDLGFVHQGIEKVRLTATGLGIGTTSPDKLLDVSYYKGAAANSAVRVQTTNTTYNGRLIDFYKGTNHHGNIGLSTVSYGQGVNLTSQGGGIRACNQFSTVRVSPCTGDGGTKDDSVDLGESYNSFDDIYATNGTIQTSDRNRKQDIEELTDAERRVAVACKGLLRKFRWISAVEEKGDDARIHFGIIAQDLQDAFTAEGLDAGKYAMFISNTWWVHEGLEYEQDAPEGAIEKTRLGVRYPELLAFIIAAL